MASPIGRVLLMDKGAYSGSTVYNQLDWVRDNGAAWVCKVDGTVGIAPPTLPTTSNANWTLMAADGSVSGSVNWSAINNKPFDSVAAGGGLSVNASKELELDTSYLTGSNVSYDNTGSGATSTNVQDAIDELFAGGGGASKLDDLSDVSIDSATLDDGQILAYNLTDEEFQNVDMPTGGHTMKPDPTVDPSTLTPPKTNEENVVDAVKVGLLEGYPNDDVPSLNTLGTWSNCDAKIILTTANKDDDGVGTWEAEGTWDGVGGSRVGWLWSEALYHILDDGQPTPTRNYYVELIPVFDIEDSEVISLYAYRIDDDVDQTIGGQTVKGGAIAFKFNGKVQNANGIKVGVKLVYQRTEVNDTGRRIS